MKPSELSSRLRQIATAIDNTNAKGVPVSAARVAADLKKVVAMMGQDPRFSGLQSLVDSLQSQNNPDEPSETPGDDFFGGVTVIPAGDQEVFAVKVGVLWGPNENSADELIVRLENEMKALCANGEKVTTEWSPSYAVVAIVKSGYSF